jgi:hypothetical protein
MMYNFEESKGGGDVRDRQSTGSPVAWMSPPSSRYIFLIVSYLHASQALIVDRIGILPSAFKLELFLTP